MAKTKLTPWFPPEVKPVHVGWYHTDIPVVTRMTGDLYEASKNRWWDGAQWWIGKYDVSEISQICQSRQWRGIDKPKKDTK